MASASDRRVALLSWATGSLIVALLAAGLLGRLGPTAMGIDARPETSAFPLPLGPVASEAEPEGQGEGQAWAITWVRPAGLAWVAGVRPGDRLLVVDGQPPSPAWEGRWNAATSLVVEQSGGGEALSVDAGQIAGFGTAEKAGSPMLVTFSLLAVGGAFMLIGLLAWRQAPTDPRALVLLVFCLSLGTALSLAPATSQGLGWSLVGIYYALPLASLLFAAFFHGFLAERLGMAGKRAVLAAIASVTLLAVASFLAYPWVYAAGTAGYDGLRRLNFLAMIGGFGLGLTFAVLSYARQSPEGREQLRIMVAGTALGFAPFVLLSLLPLAVGGPVTVRPEVSILAAVLMPLGMAYAILRHQLMGIRHLVYRGTVYAVLFSGLYLVYALLLLAQRRLAPALGDEAEATLALAFVFLAVATFPRALSLAQGLVDRLLYRDSYDYRATLERLSLEMATIHEPRLLARRVLGPLAEAMNLRFAGLTLPGGSPLTLELHRERPGLSRATRAELELLLTGGSAPGANGDPPPDRAPDRAPARDPAAGTRTPNPGSALATRRLVSMDGEVLILPLDSGGQPRGTLLLGPKATGELFRPDDLFLLRTFAGQLAVALDNAHLVEALRELNRQLLHVVEDERRRIAADLHDGPQQELIALGRQLERSGASETARQQVRELRDELRELASRLRPPVLDDLGLAAALDWLVQRVNDRGPLLSSLAVEGLGLGERLSPEAEVALFRVAQESLNNASSHGGARCATVQVRREGAALELTVRDDGAGFDSGALTGAPLRGHYGVAGMRERVAQLDGALEIESSPGRGTTVRARLPLRAAAVKGNGHAGAE